MGHNIMELENVPELFQNKPRWVWCMALTSAVLVMVVSTISVGAMLGYTYCYIEHHNSPITGNVTQSANLQIIHMPYTDSPEAQYNRTINGAIMSSVLMSKIVSLSQAVVDGDLGCMPLMGDYRSSVIL